MDTLAIALVIITIMICLQRSEEAGKKIDDSHSDGLAITFLILFVLLGISLFRS